MSGLLTALRAAAREEEVFVPEPMKATTFVMENGKIVLMPEAHQLIKGRPVVGA